MRATHGATSLRAKGQAGEEAETHEKPGLWVWRVRSAPPSASTVASAGRCRPHSMPPTLATPSEISSTHSYPLWRAPVVLAVVSSVPVRSCFLILARRDPGIDCLLYIWSDKDAASPRM